MKSKQIEIYEKKRKKKEKSFEKKISFFYLKLLIQILHFITASK